MRWRLVTALCLLPLAACTSYQPKPGEPVARLRFVTYSGDMSEITMQDLGACPERKQIVYQQLSGLIPRASTRLGMAGAPEQGARDFEELVFPANQKAAMIVTSSRASAQYVPGYRCQVGLTFDARADAQYEVQYRYEGNSCSARVYEVRAGSDAAATKVAEPSVRLFAARQYADQCAFR